MARCEEVRCFNVVRTAEKNCRRRETKCQELKNERMHIFVGCYRVAANMFRGCWQLVGCWRVRVVDTMLANGDATVDDVRGFLSGWLVYSKRMMMISR